MKHLLPQVFARAFVVLATPMIVLLLAASSAPAQDNSDHGRHRHFLPGADAALRIEVRIVSYTMKPPKHYRDDDDAAAIIYNMPLRQPAMSVSEEERPITGKVAFGPMVIDAGQGALLRTTTVVPE